MIQQRRLNAIALCNGEMPAQGREVFENKG
jgi:hypothetical protein